jgi:hypothetical protein
LNFVLEGRFGFFFHKQILAHCFGDIVHGKVVSKGEEKLKDGTWIFVLFFLDMEFLFCNMKHIDVIYDI